MDVIETDRAHVQVNSAGATSYVNNYKIMTMLGEGTFSKVYLCQNEAGNEFVRALDNNIPQPLLVLMLWFSLCRHSRLSTSPS